MQTVPTQANEQYFSDNSWFGSELGTLLCLMKCYFILGILKQPVSINKLSNDTNLKIEVTFWGNNVFQYQQFPHPVMKMNTLYFTIRYLCRQCQQSSLNIIVNLALLIWPITSTLFHCHFPMLSKLHIPMQRVLTPGNGQYFSNNSWMRSELGT